jgi:hypothetical protein
LNIVPFGLRLKAITKTCKQCSQTFHANRKDKVFCTFECKQQYCGSVWRSRNKEKAQEASRAYHKDIKNSQRLKDQSKQYRLENADRLKQKKKEWQEEFKRKHGVSHATFRRQNSLNERIKHNIRVRINKAIKGINKAGSAVEELGCSIEEFKIYIQNRLSPGMSWDNYGEWHIDHITPLNSFDLTDPKQFKIACHHTNLSPLWAEDNLMKGHKNLFV